MNKSELIDHIAKQADISKAAAGRALEAMIGGVKSTLKKSGTVSIVGFGTFAVSKRAGRTGRNPRTGAAIKIKAAKVPKFRPAPLRATSAGCLAQLVERRPYKA
ncbi:MAG: HU family DNA-binding protein [Burkholderiaceae bacterium]|nr:HU family DNA-binding protein [Burkholderiaceae bacterium]